MGNGDRSMAGVGDLFLKLSQALIILSGIQQPVHPECQSAVNRLAVEIEDGQEELEEIATDIFVALTGKNPVLPK